MLNHSFYLGSVFLILFYFWIISFKLSSYFIQAKSCIFFFFICVVFAYLLMTLYFIFYDIFTTSPNKDDLILKEQFFLKFIFVLELLLLIVLPWFYCFYYSPFVVQKENKSSNESNSSNTLSSTANSNKTKKTNFKVNKEMKVRMYYFLFSGLLVTFNIIYFMLGKYIYFPTETGFASEVPQALAEKAVMKSDFEKLVYFNLSIINMIGKLFAFTYLPFGMAKYVSILLLPDLDQNFNKESHQKDIKRKQENNNYNEKDHKDNSSGERHNSNALKGKSEIENKLNNGTSIVDYLKKDMKEIKIHKNNCNRSFHEENKISIDEDSSFLIAESQSFIEKHKNDILNRSFNSVSLRITNSNKNEFVTNFFIQGLTFLLISILQTIYKLTCIFLLFGIIETKIAILYTKVFQNICGIQCGFLSFRNDKLLTLENLLKFLKRNSVNSILEFDFLFFCLLISFRILTIYNALLVKGVAFLTFTFYKLEKNISNKQIILAVWTILFVGIVLLFDVNYLVPDYIRFNGLPESCDYTMMNESNCGISYFGLLLIKISMNFHILMYYDIIATFVFIISGLFWSYRLIIKPIILLCVDECVIFLSKPKAEEKRSVNILFKFK